MTVTGIVRRLAGVLVLGPALDGNYLATREAALPWASVVEAREAAAGA